MRVRQRDIARHAGVSQAAVSLVVSGKAVDGGVSTATQERIRRAMSDLGYVANPAARSLRGGRNGLIGVHTYEPAFPSRTDDYFHEFLVGIEEEAAHRAQDLVLFASTQQSDGRRSIYARGANRLRLADGAIIVGLRRDDVELRQLVAEGYPFVVLGRHDRLPEAAWLGVDYPPAVVAIVADLHRAGHRRLVYVEGALDALPQQERRAALVAAAGADQVSRVQAPALSVADVGRWSAAGATAVVVEGTESADVVGALLREAGVEVPTDLTVVVLDTPTADGPAAGWSHLRIPKRRIGARTVTLLAAILDGDLPTDHHELVGCEPHTLDTIAPVRP